MPVRAMASLAVHCGAMTGPFPSEHKPRRGYARLRLGIPARLLCLDGQRPVTLIDLSQSGAKLEVTGPGKVSGGLLRWLHFEAFGDPVWHFGDMVALQFDEPIDPAWLIETRHRAPAEMNRALRTRQAARDWVSGWRGFGTER